MHKHLKSIRAALEEIRPRIVAGLAMKAGKRAAQASDADIRMTFLRMKEMWLDLADEIDRRQQHP